MKLMKIWNHVCFVLLVGVICAPLMAQTATALGVVTDDSGAAVPGANVTFTNVDTGQPRSTETDSAGSYRLASAKRRELRSPGHKRRFWSDRSAWHHADGFAGSDHQRHAEGRGG